MCEASGVQSWRGFGGRCNNAVMAARNERPLFSARGLAAHLLTEKDAPTLQKLLERCHDYFEIVEGRLTRVAEKHALPFDPMIPNATTVAAMKEARAGKLPRAAGIEGLRQALDADD